MLQRDYFMRITEMLTAALVKILFNKENKNFDEAEKEIETAAKTIAGFDFKLIALLGEDDVVALAKTSEPYAGRCIVGAELLKEYGDILTGKQKPEAAINVYKKSLHLYIEAQLSKELPSPEEYQPRIDFLIKNLSQTGLSPTVRTKLIDYFEMTGRFAKAEDVIFELIDEKAEGIEKKAVSFYNRLRQKPDEELVKGNLTRKELDESLEEVQFKLNKNS